MVGVAAHRQSPGDCLSPDAERGQVCDDGFQHFAQPDLLFTLREALIVVYCGRAEPAMKRRMALSYTSPRKRTLVNCRADDCFVTEPNIPEATSRYFSVAGYGRIQPDSVEWG